MDVAVSRAIMCAVEPDTAPRRLNPTPAENRTRYFPRTEFWTSVQMFTWPVRIYYEDTDSGGVVYYANYLKFMERARSEWLRAIGYEQDVLARQGIIFAVRSAALQFL